MIETITKIPNAPFLFIGKKGQASILEIASKLGSLLKTDKTMDLKFKKQIG